VFVFPPMLVYAAVNDSVFREGLIDNRAALNWRVR
jgi:hypothetical protein